MPLMNWGKLLNTKRVRPSGTKDSRNAFDKDYDRVITSSSVRRLQDKAQVYPLQENDFIRTRLTHSLEVAALARSMGKNVGKKLVKARKMRKKDVESLASLLEVAGLLHDLGNPPFGHAGETIIQNWFDKKKDEILQKVSNDKDVEKCIEDYKKFDGNAQTIRILSRLQSLKKKGGMNLTFGTLATLVKYPNSGQNKKAFFESEKGIMNSVFQAVGMRSANGIKRHPATYILEAADDIAYLFADLEDTVKKGYLPWYKVKPQLCKLAKKSPAFAGLQQEISSVSKDWRNSPTYHLDPNEIKVREVMALRVFCQGRCVELACNEFIRRYKEIIEGSFPSVGSEYIALLDEPVNKKFLEKVRSICQDYAYHNKEVLSLELIGREVLRNLLEQFVFAAIHPSFNKKKTPFGKLYALISENFKYTQDFTTKREISSEAKIRLVVDFISCMTDSYALRLHKMLSGMILP